ncbi:MULTISPECIES: hypothetical protein [unclassified Mycobacterium]|uniref:hypothetical protein n=1 Tax=unclassified Mycobacterium TaxID=2642494 RepID=UPI000A4EDA2F|nr:MULTISPECIES: hypothetical protein [unclassified Mycobacterium]
MKITRTLPIVCAAFGAAGLFLTASAQADPGPDGTYRVAWPTENRFDTWTFTSTCATEGCTATRNDGAVFTLTNGRWVHPSSGHGACGDAVRSEYSIDAGFNLGTMKVFWEGQCGNHDVDTYPFALTRA